MMVTLFSMAIPLATAAPVPVPQFPGLSSFGGGGFPSLFGSFGGGSGAGNFDISKFFGGLSKSSDSSDSSSSSTTNLSDLLKYFQDLQKASSSSSDDSKSSDTSATDYWKAITDFWKAIYDAYEKQQMSGSGGS